MWFVKNLCLTNNLSKSISEFMNEFVRANLTEVYVEISRMQGALRELEDIYYLYTFDRPLRLRIVSLDSYNRTNKCTRDGEALINLLEKNVGGKVRNGKNLLMLLWKCVFAWLAGGNSKKKTVWFFGEPNTGKTTVAQALLEIFDGANVTIKGGWTHDTNYELMRSKFKTNLVVLNEANAEHLFTTMIDDMKTLLESLGMTVNKKHMALVRKYDGAGVYICSNILPLFSRSMTLSMKKT